MQRFLYIDKMWLKKYKEADERNIFSDYRSKVKEDRKTSRLDLEYLNLLVRIENQTNKGIKLERSRRTCLALTGLARQHRPNLK